MMAKRRIGFWQAGQRRGLAAKRRRRRKNQDSIMEDIMELCDVVRETAFAIHRYHKHGHLEKKGV
jgi:hypothetical protein